MIHKVIYDQRYQSKLRLKGNFLWHEWVNEGLKAHRHTQAYLSALTQCQKVVLCHWWRRMIQQNNSRWKNRKRESTCRIFRSKEDQGPGGGGGGTQVQRGVAPALRISRKKGSFFKTYACPRFCKRRVLFCTQVRSMGVKIPLQSTKFTRLWRRVTAEVTWASEFAAATCCR